MSAPARAGTLSTLAPFAGDTPPAFKLPSIGGADAGPSGGEIVLVHFFATWCLPCRDELPALDRFAARAGGRLRVLSISVAEPVVRVRRFFETMKVGYPVLLDADRAVSKAWGIRSLPATIVLDRQGVARLAAHDVVDWDAIDTGSFETLLVGARDPVAATD